MLQTEPAVRRTGALVALAAACGLVVVVLLAPPVAGSSYAAVLALYVVYLLGCAAVLLSPPAHRVVSELARRASARELWTAARVFLLKQRFFFSAASSHRGPPGGCATWKTEAAMRRTGALVALGAASVLVPAVQELHHGVLAAVYAILQLGCAAVLLSPARRAAEATSRKLHGTSARANTVLRWAGFACIVFCCVATDMPAAEKEANGLLLLFLLFMAGVWTVSLSVLLAASDPPPLPLWLPRPPPPPAAAEEDRHGGVVNGSLPAAARGAVA